MDEAKLNEFLGRFVSDLGATVAAGSVVLGDRLGLYKALSEQARDRGRLGPTDGNRRPLRDRMAERTGGRRLRDLRPGHWPVLDDRGADVRAGGPKRGRHCPARSSWRSGHLRPEPYIAEKFRTGSGYGWHEQTTQRARGLRAVLPTRLRGEPGAELDPGARTA